MVYHALQIMQMHNISFFRQCRLFWSLYKNHLPCTINPYFLEISDHQSTYSMCFFVGSNTLSKSLILIQLPHDRLDKAFMTFICWRQIWTCEVGNIFLLPLSWVDFEAVSIRSEHSFILSNLILVFLCLIRYST